MGGAVTGSRLPTATSRNQMAEDDESGPNLGCQNSKLGLRTQPFENPEDFLSCLGFRV